MNQLYKVHYKNLTDGESSTHYIYVNSWDLKYKTLDDILHQSICDEEHMYHGNQGDGHGEFEIDYKQVSRLPDESLYFMQEGLLAEKERVEKQLIEIENMLKTPYHEIV